MQVIIISPNSNSHKHWHLSKTNLLLLLVSLVMLITISSVSLANWLRTRTDNTNTYIEPVIEVKEPEVYVNELFDDETVQNFYARQLGGLQAETIRLKMLSQRLTEMAGLDLAEFALAEKPAQGGLEHKGTPLTVEQLDQGLKKISLDLQNQLHNLAAVEQFLLTEQSLARAIPQGKPIEKGWLSSYYGYRIDPFSGEKTFHRGVDFAGLAGSPVIAVAEGIVSWVGKRSGYGGTIEVDHGNGYVTRYAHNKEITAEIGDHVIKGQQLAVVGSTGRSTGPHVHFEILHDGQHVNPQDFLK